MKIQKKPASKVFATVTRAEIDEEFEKFGDSENQEVDYDEDFPTETPQSPMSEYLTLFNKAMDHVQSAIQALVKSSKVSKDVSEAAQRAAKESVKDLSVVLAELQLATTEVEPK